MSTWAMCETHGLSIPPGGNDCGGGAPGTCRVGRSLYTVDMNETRIQQMIDRCERSDMELEPIRDKMDRVLADRADFRRQIEEQDATLHSARVPERTDDDERGQNAPVFEHDGPKERAEAIIAAEDIPVGMDESAAELTFGGGVSEGGNMLAFDTGATRNRKENELRYDGFLSPLALQMFARYMHKNRKTADGTIREPDNWQKGMPNESYLDSLLRHVMDIWLIYRGYPEAARESKFEALSGAFFNIQGLMHNWMTEDITLEEVLATLAATGTLEQGQ